MTGHKQQSGKSKETNTISEAIENAKSAVYSLTRIRQVNGSAEILTIGTAFLVGPNKLMTCAHVIDNTDPQVDPQANPLAFHNDGDTYYLLRKDPYDGAHFYRLSGKKGENVHTYPDVDAAVITVNDDFYSNGGKALQDKETFLRLNMTPQPLGLEVSILGYPAEQDLMGHKGIYDDPASSKGLNDELVILRVDAGIINARYNSPIDKLATYDFTMAFNPGNSGGPIIGLDGSVIAIVRQYKAFPIRQLIDSFTITMPDGSTQTLTVPNFLRSTYSIGLAPENLDDVIKEHSLPCAK